MKPDLNVNELFPEIMQIKNEEYRKLIDTIWQELWHTSNWVDINDLPISPKRT